LRTWCTNLCGGRFDNEACRCGVFAGTSVKPAADNKSSFCCTGLQAAVTAHTTKDTKAVRIRGIVPSLLFCQRRSVYRLSGKLLRIARPVA
jgi:hypothetical protein